MALTINAIDHKNIDKRTKVNVINQLRSIMYVVILTRYRIHDVFSNGKKEHTKSNQQGLNPV